MPPSECGLLPPFGTARPRVGMTAMRRAIPTDSVTPPAGCPIAIPSVACAHGLGARRGRWLMTALALTVALGGLGCDLLFHRDLPARMIGMPQTFSSDGGGLAEIRRLRGLSGDTRSGAFAIYGGGVVSLWVAGARDTGAAQGLIR